MMTTSRAWVTASCPSVRNTTAPTVTMAPIVSTSVSAASSTTPLATLRAAFSLTGFGKLNSSRVVMTCPLSFALRSDLVILSCVTRGLFSGTDQLLNSRTVRIRPTGLTDRAQRGRATYDRGRRRGGDGSPTARIAVRQCGQLVGEVGERCGVGLVVDVAPALGAVS